MLPAEYNDLLTQEADDRRHRLAQEPFYLLYERSIQTQIEGHGNNFTAAAKAGDLSAREQAELLQQMKAFVITIEDTTRSLEDSRRRQRETERLRSGTIVERARANDCCCSTMKQKRDLADDTDTDDDVDDIIIPKDVLVKLMIEQERELDNHDFALRTCVVDGLGGSWLRDFTTDTESGESGEKGRHGKFTQKLIDIVHHHPSSPQPSSIVGEELRNEVRVLTAVNAQLEEVFREFGQVSASVIRHRVPDADKPHNSWALVSFVRRESLDNLLEAHPDLPLTGRQKQNSHLGDPSFLRLSRFSSVYSLGGPDHRPGGVGMEAFELCRKIDLSQQAKDTSNGGSRDLLLDRIRTWVDSPPNMMPHRRP